MRAFFETHRKRLLFFVPVVLGALVLALALTGRTPPVRMAAVEAATSVRVITVSEVTLVPRAIGYGNVQPGRIWEAVAEVGGQVLEVHPQLKKGAIVAKGEILLRIDPTDYRLAVAQTEADIMAVKARLKELDAKEKNARQSLDIEQRSLDLSNRDLERKRKLLQQNTVSQAAVDQEERNVLVRRQSVQVHQNTLNLIPAERDVLKAELAQKESRLTGARLNLERTTITAPFDCRIAEVYVEETQFAAQGKVLAVADDIGVSEVSAQVPMGRLINLIPIGTALPDLAAGIMSRLPDMFGFAAVVRLSGGGVKAEWEARFTRVSDTVDPETRAVGVIVAVDDPYRQAVPGKRPPLSKNMFVEVELRGRAQAHRIVVPRSSLHDGAVYVATPENRLDIRSVEVSFTQTDFAVIRSGLTPGERIVVSDPVPAIGGMLLAPVPDPETEAALIAEAEGRGSVR